MRAGVEVRAQNEARLEANFRDIGTSTVEMKAAARLKPHNVDISIIADNMSSSTLLAAHCIKLEDKLNSSRKYMKYNSLRSRALKGKRIPVVFASLIEKSKARANLRMLIFGYGAAIPTRVQQCVFAAIYSLRKAAQA